MGTAGIYSVSMCPTGATRRDLGGQGQGDETTAAGGRETPTGRQHATGFTHYMTLGKLFDLSEPGTFPLVK